MTDISPEELNRIERETQDADTLRMAHALRKALNWTKPDNGKEIVMVSKNLKGGLSARDTMPSDEAEARARRDPQPGDQWTEMFSYWVHVDKRVGSQVLVREYSPPCKIDPEEARVSKWMSVTDFQNDVKYMSFSGNEHIYKICGQQGDALSKVKKTTA